MYAEEDVIPGTEGQSSDHEEEEEKDAEDVGFDNEDGEDEEADNYERDNPETAEEREMFNAETPEDDTNDSHLELNAQDRETGSSSFLNHLQERYGQQDESDDVIMSTDDDSDDGDLVAVSAAEKRKRAQVMRKTGTLDAFCKKQRDKDDNDEPKGAKRRKVQENLQSSESENEDEEMVDASVLPESEIVADESEITMTEDAEDYANVVTENEDEDLSDNEEENQQSAIVADNTEAPIESGGGGEDPDEPMANQQEVLPEIPLEILKHIDDDENFTHGGQKILLDLNHKSRSNPLAYTDATKCFEFLIPINLFETKIGENVIHPWYYDQKSFKKFQAAYLMAYLATKCQETNKNVSVSLWPVSSSSRDHKDPNFSFRDGFNTNQNTVYFIHIICYDMTGLEAFSKYMTCFLEEETSNNRRGHNGSLVKDPFKVITRFQSRPSAIGHLALKCQSRLPKQQWAKIAGGLLTDASTFSRALVLLAVEDTKTILANPMLPKYVYARASEILPVCKLINGGVQEESEAVSVEESPCMKEMFSLERVLTHMIQSNFEELVTTMLLNRPEFDANGDPASLDNFILWPDDRPAFCINPDNVYNLPCVVDAKGSNSFPLSCELVADPLRSSNGNQEIIVDTSNNLRDIYDKLEMITSQDREGDEFSRKNNLIRLVLSKTSELELPWHKSLKKFMRFVEDHEINIERFIPPLESKNEGKTHNIGNVFANSFWHHCQHGSQIGNVHTPMTKLLYIGLAGLLTKPQHTPAGMIFYGIYSGGKSFMFELLQEMFPTGAVESTVGGSAQSLLQNVSKIIKVMHEEDKNILKDTMSEGLSLAKAFTQPGKQMYERNEQTPEGTFRVTRLEFNNKAVWCRATNSGLYKVDPAFLSRNVVCNIGSQNPTNRNKEALALSAQTKASSQIKTSFNEAFMIQFFLYHHLDMLTAYCGENIENNLYTFIYAKVGELHSSLNVANPRTGGFVRNFARVHTLMTCVQVCLNGLECFTADDIENMRDSIPITAGALHPDHVIVDQLEEMSNRKSILNRLGMEIHTLLMCHMACFDGAASIFFGMSIPFDTTATICAQEVLMVLKDLCYAGVSLTENQDYIQINYKKPQLIEAIIQNMKTQYNRRRDEETIRTALQELGLRVVKNAGVDSAAVSFQEKTVEISKKLISTTTTINEQWAFQKLGEKGLVFEISKVDGNWKYGLDSKFNFAGHDVMNGEINRLADQLCETVEETTLYFIPYSLSSACITSQTLSQLRCEDDRIGMFMEKFHTVMPIGSFECHETQGIVFPPKTYKILKTLDTTVAASKDVGEMHIGFSKAAQLVGLFEGDFEDDSYLVVEPQTRDRLEFGLINKETAQMGREPFIPKPEDYKVKNARHIPKEEHKYFSEHVKKRVEHCSETVQDWIEFKPGQNNENIIERQVFELSPLGKKIKTEEVKDIIFARICREGLQKAFKDRF